MRRRNLDRDYWNYEDPRHMSLSDNDLSEQAESWLNNENLGDTDNYSVYCGNCGSDMHMSSHGENFQMTCSYCGVRGPIDDTRYGARELSRALFHMDV